MRQHPPRTMTRDKSFCLWCLVDGNTMPFSITVNVNNNTDQLIRKLKDALWNNNSSDLVLWKVRMASSNFTSENTLYCYYD
jgi:hypothetical protein